jgi:hypothetical protein
VSTDESDSGASDKELDDDIIKALQRHSKRDMEFSEEARKIINEVQK